MTAQRVRRLLCVSAFVRAMATSTARLTLGGPTRGASSSTCQATQ
jgi:hypothetical protein